MVKLHVQDKLEKISNKAAVAYFLFYSQSGFDIRIRHISKHYMRQLSRLHGVLTQKTRI